MKKSSDILLINSFALRQRIVSDAALENGLAIIRTHLEDAGFSVEVIDEQRVSGAEQGVPLWCLYLLRLFTKFQLLAYGKIKLVALALIVLAWPLQSLALFYRKKYMDQLIVDIANYVHHHTIPIIGIKTWNGDAYTWSIQLAQKLRQASPETTIIAGGPQVKVYGEKVLAVREFDLVIMGPGEEILAALLKLRKKSINKEHFLKSVREQINPSRLICTGNYNKTGSYMFNAFTIPRYTPADLEDKILFHTLVDGMGCTWNNCNFCSHARQNSNYTTRPLAEIKDEILTMSAQGISFFRFSSSETPLSHGKAIARMLLENNITAHYSMFVRAGKVTPETYEAYCLMIRSGLRAVFMGGETGHDLINSVVMNKGITKKDIIDTIQCIKLASTEVGIPCKIGLSLIYPTPIVENVSLQDVFNENISLIENSLPDTIIVNPPGILPGTTWFDRPEAFGFEIADNYTTNLMHYEYSMYKPVHVWKKLDFLLNGKDMYSILAETARMHKAVESMHIPVGISDEYLMMLTAIGHGSKTDLLIFKKHSLIDIMTGSSHYIKQIVEKINTYSRKMAAQNHTVNEPEGAGAVERLPAI